MFRGLVIRFALILLSLVAGRVSAQPQMSGYVVLTIAPEPGMIALGTEIKLSALNAQTGANELRVGHITGYVAWYQPIRPPEYHVTLDNNVWLILNRETLAQDNPALATSRFGSGG